MTDNNDTRLISRSELAVAIGIHPVTVGRWANSGLIPYYLVGTKRRYNLNEVMESLRKAPEVAHEQAEA